jgi:hypothetical protein
VTKRLAVLVLATLLFGLAAEGVLSLGFGRSFAELWRPRDARLESMLAQSLSLEATLHERAARTPGPYRVDEDPLVGYSLKREAEVDYLGQTVRTDALGLRLRSGPAPGPDPIRIVFLGDSVAFGHGLADEDVISAQAEAILRDLRPAGARDVVCTSVAVPSWNYRNALYYLLDHLDVLDPDVVLYMDVDNDLDDSYGADEVGQRILLEDPGTPDPMLNFRASPSYYKRSMHRLAKAGRSADPATFGPQAQQAGLSFASRWRIEDMARRVAEAARLFEARGGHFALLPYVQHQTHRQVRARLARLGAQVPVIPLLETVRDADTLGTDPHPNAVTERALAIWTLATLLDWGWIPGGASGPLPPVDPSFAGRRAREPSDAEALAWSEAYERDARADLERRVVSDTLQGMLQIYGGLNLDGTFGARLGAVLPQGRLLRVHLAPFEERPDLYPLEIEVAVDGRPVGKVALASVAAGLASTVFALDPECATRPFEVVLKSERWCVHEELVVAARFVAFESVE